MNDSTDTTKPAHENLESVSRAQVEGAKTSIAIPKCLTDDEYTVTVVAINTIGSSPASKPSPAMKCDATAAQPSPAKKQRVNDGESYHLNASVLDRSGQDDCPPSKRCCKAQLQIT
jgi:hypothetical protein